MINNSIYTHIYVFNLYIYMRKELYKTYHVTYHDDFLHSYLLRLKALLRG